MSEWREVAIEDLAAKSKSALATGPFGSAVSSKHFVDDGVPMIRGSNLSTDVGTRLNDDKIVLLSREVAAKFERSTVRSGDLVFTCWGTIGQIGLIDETSEHERYIVSNKQMKLTPNPDLVDSRFLYYALSSSDNLSQVQGQAIGSAVPGFNLGQLRQIRVSIPSVEAQLSITSILKSFDDLIDSNRRRIEILEEMARLLYREWFVQYRFPGAEAVETVESDVGQIPKDWHVTNVGEAAENFDRFRKPLSRMEREEFQGPYPYYGAAKIFDYVADFIFDGEYLLLAEDGTVVTNDGGPVLQLVNGQFWPNNHTHVLQGTALPTRVLYLALQDYPISGHITGAAQPKITQANMNRIPLIQPPDPLIHRFVGVVDPMLDLAQNLAKQNSCLATARDLLLPRLVSGELDVSELELDLEAVS